MKIKVTQDGAHIGYSEGNITCHQFQSYIATDHYGYKFVTNPISMTFEPAQMFMYADTSNVCFSAKNNKNVDIPTCNAYQQFYRTLGGPDWTNCSDYSLNPCDCSRIVCDNSKITSLDMKWNNLKGDISGVKGLIDLSYLDIRESLPFHNISGELSVLQDISGLRYFASYSVHITGNMSTLPNSLTDLTLASVGISGDIIDLSGLDKLTSLELDNMLGVSVNMSTLPNSLTDLTLASVGISGDIIDLSGLDKLTSLELDNMLGVSVNMSTLPNSLTSLGLDTVGISGDIIDLSGLDKLTSLELVNMRGVSVNMSTLPNSLTSLGLDTVGISGDIIDLSGRDKLTSLELENMRGVSVNMSTLPNTLTELYLDTVGISGDIIDLSGLDKLTSLDLDNMRDVSVNMSTLPNTLTELYLDTVGISGDIIDLSGLDKLTSLELDLSYVTGSCQDVSTILDNNKKLTKDSCYVDISLNKPCHNLSRCTITNSNSP